jgi:phenylalanyl-tRNA synthetase beta chain
MVTVPTRRPDLRDEWDLIEEIGRMHGYDGIEATAPRLPLTASPANPEKRLERLTKEYLVSAGFDELMTYSFYGDKDIMATRLPLDAHLELENPLNPDQKYLRLSLVPLHLRKAVENRRHFESFDCFEWGKVYAKEAKTKRPVEISALSLLSVSAKRHDKGNGFYALKGKVEAMLEALHIDISRVTLEAGADHPEVPVLALLHPSRSACYVVEGRVIGMIGEIHPAVEKSFGLDGRVSVAGFVTSELQALQTLETTFVPLQKFPYALRDISLIFPRKMTVSEVERFLSEAGAPLLQNTDLFDIYEQGDEKSFAFHLSFGASDRTLSGAEMDEAFDRIVALAGEHGGRLRV